MMEGRVLYPVVVFAGLLVSYWALRRRVQASSLDEQQRTAVGLAAFFGAMLGSKLPFWLASSPPTSGWLWIADGKTILGGIFGGYLAVEFVKRPLGIQERTGDNFAVPIALAVAFGRLGCFLAGCCFGLPTAMAWGVTFPDTAGDFLPRHPTQLYEAAFHFAALGLLLLVERRTWLTHQRLTAYLMAYLAFRFVTEWLRPESRWLGGLTLYQFACIAMLLALLLNEYLYYRAGKRRA